MRIKTALLSAFMISTFAAGCFVEEAPESGDEQATVERGRKKLGKADHTGSCTAITHDANGFLVEKSYCGGKSYGTCWCDDACEEIGDCCDDKDDSCTVAPPPDNGCEAGEKNCGGCCGNTFCIEDTGVSCPLLMCPAYCPPPQCEATGGTCMSDPNDVTFPATCSELGLSDAIGVCGAVNQTCCGDALPPPPPAPSCVGNCGGMVGDKACFCDELCADYEDCCSDYEQVCVQ
jgi:hypothetical protein